jgi:hypothetical protein
MNQHGGSTMSGETSLQQHYTHGGLEAALLAALTAAGKNVDHLSPADLMGADEFHVGGAQATTTDFRAYGAIISFTPQARRYFNRAYYFEGGLANDRWSGSGPIKQVPRRANLP